MIVLHTGNEARDRIEKIVRGTSGDVFRTPPNALLTDTIDAISEWIANSALPSCIVVDPARATNDADVEAYRKLRRMAKFSGIDVHMAGEDAAGTVDEVVDRFVSNDSELELTAPGSSAGSQIAQLMQAETMTPFERVEMDVPTWQEVMAMSSCDEAEAKSKVDWLKQQAVWANNIYQVNVEFMQGGRAHLIIRRLDKQAIHNCFVAE